MVALIVTTTNFNDEVVCANVFAILLESTKTRLHGNHLIKPLSMDEGFFIIFAKQVLEERF